MRTIYQVTTRNQGKPTDSESYAQSVAHVYAREILKRHMTKRHISCVIKVSADYSFWDVASLHLLVASSEFFTRHLIASIAQSISLGERSSE